MAKAIFHKNFTFDRRPKLGVSFHVVASTEPQTFPHDVIEAAIEAGAATAYKSPAPKKPENEK